ncbi:hypothetical protein DFH94DRAFT_764100 [Russula ochroleuca]|jgi:hypothetical protein|uniref:Uncharacterized protein n=1 Tax=Russula ochroleuca TaxID=152965 RepID=A0A9P5K1P2_9AGAM|nr:hypothetical protein DFH94DRAFT_764100 [Russula ochroleuca]
MPPTHIGIAFYTLDGFPRQWVIVLSSCQHFNSTVWCGTIIDSVNGWVESWAICENSPATFAPHLSLLGVIKVETVNKEASDIVRSISNLAWKAQESRNCNGGKKYPPSDEYVRQVVLHLCRERTITLPPRVKVTFTTHIEGRISKLREKSASKINMYPIIPIGEGEVVFGQTKVTD